MNGKTYHDYKKRGVAYLPAARLEKGLVPGLPSLNISYCQKR